MKVNAKRFLSMTAMSAIAVVAATSLLAGCSKPQAPKAGWVYSKSPSQKMLRKKTFVQLRQLGAQVFVQGESVKIVIPDNKLFNVDSANLATNSGALLKAVANVVKSYTIVGVKVAAYSDTAAWSGAPQDRKLALTNSQAQSVASYLWSQGVNMRLITAQGYSSNDAVSWNGTPKGRSENNRVEVTFQFYPHLVEYN